MNNSNVKHFETTDLDCPVDLLGTKVAGWYWKVAGDSEWLGPAPGGQAQAQFNADNNMRGPAVGRSE